MKQLITRTGVLFGIVSSVCMLAFNACVKNYDLNKLKKTEYSPLLAAPLIKSSMTINDLLVQDKNGNIQVGPDHFLTLVYRGHLLSLKSEDFIVFPAQSTPFSSPALTPVDVLAFNALPVGSTYTVPFPAQTVSFNTGGSANLDSLVFKAPTKLNISISSQFRHNITIKIDIPYARRNGVAFTKTLSIPYTGSLPVTSASSLDISGYTFDLTTGGTTQNKFDATITVMLTKSANPLLPSDNVTVDVGFANPKFQRLFGYINQPLLTPSIDTVDISVFDNTLPGGGSFTIVNPAVRIYLTNSYGVPIDATFSKLQGYNPGFPPYQISVTNEPKLNPWHFPYPTVKQIGLSIKDSVILTNANTGGSSTVPGSIGYVLNNKPKRIIYQVSAKANPNGIPIKPNTNFALDTSRVKVDFQLDLPLYGTAKNITLLDTVPFEVTQNDMKEIESFLFRVNVTNGFPIDIGIQVYFTDSISPLQKYHVIDSLISPYESILPAAGVDGVTGKVNSSTSKTTDITYDQARISKLKDIKNLIISGKFSTTNNGNTNVKFYSDYKLDLRLGAMVKIKHTI